MSKLENIAQVFDAMEKASINFLLLRGSADIPDKVNIKDDIDLLVDLKDKKKVKKLFKDLGYTHMQDSLEHNLYLYHALPHDHYRDAKRDLHFDVVYNLAYRSPNMGEWVSIYEDIQAMIWKYKQNTNKVWKYESDPTDEYFHVLCHSIFDKGEFREKHRLRLDFLVDNIDMDRLSEMLPHVFFKFSESLLELLAAKKYDQIRNAYLSFKAY